MISIFDKMLTTIDVGYVPPQKKMRTSEWIGLVLQTCAYILSKCRLGPWSFLSFCYCTTLCFWMYCLVCTTSQPYLHLSFDS
jgi:hypothetical protein